VNAPPTAAQLFGAPAITAVRPSPDGTRLAFLAPVDGVLNLWLTELDGSGARPLTHATDHGWTPPRWTVDGAGLLCLRDGAGDELHHLWHVDVGSGRTTDLTPYDGVQAQLVGLSPDRPGEAAVALNLEDPARHDLYVLRLDDGGLEGPLARGATRYAVDASLTLALAVRLRPDGAAEVLGPGETVLDVVPASATVPLILGPLAASRDGAAGFALHSSGGDTVALHRYDLRTGARTTVHADPEHDVAAFSTDPLTGVVDLVGVDAARRHWSGTRSADLHDPRHDVTEVHRSAGDTTWVLTQVRDDRPPVHEVRSGGETRAVLLERPDLEDHALGCTEELELRARDGLLIRGYVTVPPGRPARRLPTVLWVHGGPWARDRWGFDPVVQHLATRGYAVVQVNYRGSSGYGNAFLDAGDREWGAKMQTDLSDAVEHLVGTGVVDRERVAIAGGSYGGYATLMGLLTEPDRYVCGIAWCAPSNLVTLLRSFPPYWAPLLEHWHTRVGHPERDAELLRERSPLTHLDRLKVPLLLVHGVNDPRVLVEESRAVAAALASRGVPCELHEVADEGHGFTKPENNVWLLERMSAFLEEHLAREGAD
jgi:dipeptidyl aminopeptidase/acylaminoacyl peptidase